MGFAYDPNLHELFVSDYFSNDVSVISTRSLAVVDTIAVGAGPWGVAYDAPKGEVYVADSGGNTVSVLNATTGRLFDTVPVGSQPMGVAVDSRDGKIFVTNADSNNVSVISDTNLTVIASIGMPAFAYEVSYSSGAVYDPERDEVFVANYYDYSISVIDARTDRVDTTIGTAGAPYFLAYDPAQREVLAANPYSGDMTVVSDRNNSVVATIKVASPNGVAYDAATRDILVVSASAVGVYVFNASSDALLTINPVDGVAPWYVLSVAGLDESFVSCLDSLTVSVLSPSQNVTRVVTVGTTPQSVAYDDRTGALFVVNSADDSVWAVSATSGHILAVVPVGTQDTWEPQSIANDPRTGDLFIANGGSDDLSEISGANYSLVRTVALPSSPTAVVYDAMSQRIFVGTEGGVSVVSGANGSVDFRLAIPGNIDTLAYDSRTGQVFAGNGDSDNLSVLSDTGRKIVATVPLRNYASALAYDNQSGFVFAYSPTDAFDSKGNLSEISDVTDRVVHVTRLAVEALIVDPSNGDLVATAYYLDGSAGMSVYILSGTNESILAHIPVGGLPIGGTFDERNGLIYVANSEQGTLSAIQIR
jgi:YVTN family beta-propeller protein